MSNVDKKGVLTLLDKAPTKKKEEGWQRHNDFTQDGGSWGCDHKLQETINGMSKARWCWHMDIILVEGVDVYTSTHQYCV